MADDNQPTSPGVLATPTDDSEVDYEALQQQLKDMEDEQNALAERLQATTNEPQLDSHLATIEEQFRDNFDERLASSGGDRRPFRRIPKQPVAGSGSWETDILCINRVFREVSRGLGDDWKPVFLELTAGFPADMVSEELRLIEQCQPLIQGYKALMAWREWSREEFNIRQLVDALHNHGDMNDLVEAAINILESNGVPETRDKSKAGKPVQRRKSDVATRKRPGIVLDNRHMLLLAKKIGGDWEGLGHALQVPDEEITEIHESEGSTYQGAFKMLWAWRQTQPEMEDDRSVSVLKTALEQVNKKNIADDLGTN